MEVASDENRIAGQRENERPPVNGVEQLALQRIY